jgi:predicted permease
VPFDAAGLARDVRQAARALRRTPAVTLIVLLSVGVGIGVNAAVFSWVQAHVLHPIGRVTAGAEFALVEPRAESGLYTGTSWPEFLDLRARLSAAPDLIAFRMAPLSVGDTSRSDRVFGLIVSPNYFTALGLQPAAGRFFSADPSVTGGGDRVAVVSHAFWRARLGGAADVVGRRLRVNTIEVTIVGVAAESFRGTVMGVVFDLFLPAGLSPDIAGNARGLDNRAARDYSVIGRLAPGATRRALQGEADDVRRAWQAEFPALYDDGRIDVLAPWQSPRGPQRMLTAALTVLQVVMVVVLVAVCGNVGTLLLARAAARRKEAAVRLSLGSGRVRLVRLLLVESALLAAGGTAVGVAIAFWGTEALRAVPMPTPGGVTVQFDTGIDLVTLAFAALLGVVSTLAFGLAPALYVARVDAQPSMRAGTGVSGRSPIRDALLVIETAVALVVLVVAAAFVRAFADARATDPGFVPAGVLLSTYDLRVSGGSVDESNARSAAARLVALLERRAGIASVALSTAVPLDIHGMPVRTFTVDGRARPDGEPDRAAANTVTSGYFDLMGIRIVAGRTLPDLADEASPASVVVNETFARTFLAGLEAIGRTLDSDGRRYVVRGVVADSLVNAFGESPTPMLYFAFRDRPSAVAEVHVRTMAGDERAATAAVRQALAAIDAALPLYNVRTLAEHVDTNLVFRRIPARMFGVLGPLLLLLSAIGVYAVAAYDAAERRADIAIRLALGAPAGRIAREVASATLRVVGIGAAAGWILALAADRRLAGDVPLDPVVFVGVPALLVAAAVVAAVWPARRAAARDPMAMLKV